MKKKIRLSEADLHRIVKESMNSLLRENEENVGEEVVNILEQLYQRGELNDYCIASDPKKWERLVNDILINRFDYPFGPATMEEAKEIYRSYVIRWKEGHKVTDMMGRTTFDFMKEDVLRNVVRNVINEVLDNMDDTEKAFWLMRQRQERPNTKSRTPVNYEQQFQNEFNNTMPYWNSVDANGNNAGYSGGYNRGGQTMNHGVDNRGNFTSDTIQPDGTMGKQTLTPNGKDYYHAKNPGDKKTTSGNMDMARGNSHNTANAQADRYMAIRNKYNQQRQSQNQQR